MRLQQAVEDVPTVAMRGEIAGSDAQGRVLARPCDAWRIVVERPAISIAALWDATDFCAGAVPSALTMHRASPRAFYPARKTPGVAAIATSSAAC
jgi:hypothetical protein